MTPFSFLCVRHQIVDVMYAESADFTPLCILIIPWKTVRSMKSPTSTPPPLAEESSEA